MEISLEEAYAGKTAQIRVPTSITCDALLRHRRQTRHPADDMRHLQWRGACARQRRGSSRSSARCPTCNGRGTIIKDPCTKCSGHGKITQERSLSVNIPAGIEDGTRIRLSGEGEAGVRGGPAGDLYIFISIKPHQFFQRDGADLYCKVPVSMTTAALGGQFEVATLDGTQTRVKVPEGTHYGKPIPPEGQGHAGAAPNRRWAIFTFRSTSKRRKT